MTWAIVLIKTSLPAFEMNFSFHPITLLVIRSCNSLKVATFDCPPTIGSPRYYSKSFMFLAPKIFFIASFTSGLVFLLKNRDFFCLLIAWLEAASYLPKMSRSRWHSSTDASQNNKQSSAKRRWDTQIPPVQDNTPCNCLVFEAFFIIPDNPSAHNRKRYGESESPCFIPLDGWTKPFGSPLIKIEYVAVFTVSMARSTHLSSKKGRCSCKWTTLYHFCFRESPIFVVFFHTNQGQIWCFLKAILFLHHRQK